MRRNSPNERPNRNPGENPGTLSGRLKSYFPDPLDPPSDTVCSECSGEGCDSCDWTGKPVAPEPEYEPEEELDF